MSSLDATIEDVKGTVDFLKRHPVGVIILILMLIEAIIDVLDIFDMLDTMALALRYGLGGYAAAAFILLLFDIVVIYQLYIFATAVGRGRRKNPENSEAEALHIIQNALKIMIVAEILWGIVALFPFGWGILYYVALFCPIVAFLLSRSITI